MRVKADRSIDKKRPPVVFNIEKARAIVKPIKYSQLGKKVSYVKLSHNLKKDFLDGIRVQLSSSGIIAYSYGGITCFNNNGKIKEIVCKNNPVSERTGLDLNWNKSKNYRGVRGIPFVIENRLYYNYFDEPNNQVWIMEYDMQQPKSIDKIQDIEEQYQPKGKRKMQTKKHTYWSKKDMMPLDKYHWVSDKSKWDSSKAGYFISVQNFSGDTVCQLKDYNPVKNFPATACYNAYNKLYHLNGHLYFRQANNDTIYRFETVNRVRPLYVIDFGKRKIKSSTDRLNPWYDSRDKYIFDDILETKQFVFIFYTKDYASLKAVKNKTVRFNCFVYDKLTGEQFHTYVAEKPIVTQVKKSKNASPLATPPFPSIQPPLKGIINDLDYGITTWKWKLAEDGRLYKLLSGKQIKEYIKSNPKNSNPANKKLLEEIADKAKDDDLFIVTISN